MTSFKMYIIHLYYPVSTHLPNCDITTQYLLSTLKIRNIVKFLKQSGKSIVSILQTLE